MRVLVTAASRHGATQAIAERIASIIRDAGLETAVHDPDEVESLDAYDAVILGSGVYAGRWLPAASRFVEKHAAALAERPVWLFSSGPIGAPVAKPDGDPLGVPAMAEQIDARAHRIFPGRVERESLSLAEKMIVKVVRAPYGDFRDWPAIEAWARAIVSQLRVTPVVSGSAAG